MKKSLKNHIIKGNDENSLKPNEMPKKHVTGFRKSPVEQILNLNSILFEFHANGIIEHWCFETFLSKWYHR